MPSSLRSPRLALIPLLVLVALACANAVTATNRDALAQLAAEFETELRLRQPPLYQTFLRSTNPGFQRLNDAPEIRLMYLRASGMPVYFADITLTAARSISTDRVWPGGGAGYELDGTGTIGTMAIWDGGDVYQFHETMFGRIWDRDGPGGDCLHPTWVAGIMIAAPGFHPEVQGMSYAADKLHAYDAANDDAEMATAAANGIYVSNHSYEIPGGWRFVQGAWYWFGDLDVDPSEDYGFGYYGPKARSWDTIAYNAPEYFIQKGCGNDRGEGPPPGTEHFHWDSQAMQYVLATDVHPVDGGTTGYDCISWFGNAKNIVSVGAVKDIPNGYQQPSDVVATSFTSFGPCDDGRIKPDVVANGDSLWMPDCTSPTAYAQKSGTSLAGPCVASSANLLRQHFQNTFGHTPRAATLKGLIIHTADEAGPSDGPDYRFGWGLMNTLTAADLITAGAGRFREAELIDTTTHTYRLVLDSMRDLRVTLQWTDPPGISPPASVDPPDRALINDLDVRLEHQDTETVFQPWVLDGADPTLPATPGDNVVDNVERIDVTDAPAGVYLVTVSHKGSLGPVGQAYSLIASDDLVTTTGVSASTPTAPAPRVGLRAQPNPARRGEPVTFDWAGTTPDEPTELLVTDVTGRRVRRIVTALPLVWNLDDDGGRPLAPGVYWVHARTAHGMEHATRLVVVR